MEPSYTYKAELIRVIDGDTIVCKIDLGFGIWWLGDKGKGVKLRLLGIDCPDVRYGSTKEAKDAATDFTRNWLYTYIHMESEIPEIVIKSHKVDNFGRCLAEVYRAGDAVSLNQALLDSGHAVKYEDRKGRKK